MVRLFPGLLRVTPERLLRSGVGNVCPACGSGVWPDGGRVPTLGTMQVLERSACGEAVTDAHRPPVDPVYALFRRAVCDADPDAWASLAVTFRVLVLSTIRQQAGSARITSDDDDDWVYRSLQRFWRAVTPARFGAFADGRSLARYLKLCAASAYLDVCRDQRRHATLDLDEAEPDRLVGPDLEAELLDDHAARELWAAVQGLLKDDDERAIAELSWVRGLTPRAIMAADGARFGSIAQVYQTKRRILDRLRLHLPTAYCSVKCW